MLVSFGKITVKVHAARGAPIKASDTPLPKSTPESSLISMKGYQKSFFSDERRNMRDGWIELKPPGLNGWAVGLGQPDGLTLSERLRSRAPSAPLS